MMNSDIRDQWLATFGSDGVLDDVTNALTTDVLLNNNANYFTGPSVPLTPTGKWLLTGAVTVGDTGTNAYIVAKLWDGTTVVASGEATISLATYRHTIPLSAVVTLATSATFSIACKDVTAATGRILAATPTDSNIKASYLNAVRLGSSS